MCPLSQSEAAATLKQLAGELDNFEEIARYLLPQPGEVPALAGIDIYGGSLSLNGRVGGDHLIYVDFKQRFDLEARIQRATEQNRFGVIENLRRCQTKAGIVLIDVAGTGSPMRCWRRCSIRPSFSGPPTSSTCSGRLPGGCSRT